MKQNFNQPGYKEKGKRRSQKTGDRRKRAKCFKWFDGEKEKEETGDRR